MSKLHSHFHMEPPWGGQRKAEVNLLSCLVLLCRNQIPNHNVTMNSSSSLDLILCVASLILCLFLRGGHTCALKKEVQSRKASQQQELKFSLLQLSLPFCLAKTAIQTGFHSKVLQVIIKSPHIGTSGAPSLPDSSCLLFSWFYLCVYSKLIFFLTHDWYRKTCPYSMYSIGWVWTGLLP